jgi:hypothetical protein
LEKTTESADISTLGRLVYWSSNLRWKGVEMNKEYERVPDANI